MNDDPRGYKESVGKPSLNLYEYCGNNPLRFVDPFGTDYVVSFQAGVGAAGIITATYSNSFQLKDVSVGLGVGAGVLGTIAYTQEIVKTGSDNIGYVDVAGGVGNGLSVGVDTTYGQNGATGNASAGVGLGGAATATVNVSLTGLYNKFFGNNSSGGCPSK